MVEVKSYFRKPRNKKEMSANNRKAALARWRKNSRINKIMEDTVEYQEIYGRE